MFPHKNIHKQTWISNDGVTRNQIDHILDARHSSKILNVKSCRRADGDSDHILVRAKTRLRIPARKGKNRSKKMQWDIEILKNCEINQLYHNEMEQICTRTIQEGTETYGNK